jgi:hypothetical protein
LNNMGYNPYGSLPNTPPAPPPLISDNFQVSQATPNIYQPYETQQNLPAPNTAGVPGGKMGADIASQMEAGGSKTGGGNMGANANQEQPRPDVYQQPQQAPITQYNPNAPVATQSYDAMMQGVAPQDFNRVFSQVSGQTPQEQQMAGGGIAGYSLGGYAAGGNPRLLNGPGDGMSDNIPATIGDRQPARLADGEFVVPADVVSHLGNGSTDAGAKHLYKMMDKVRTARTGKKAQGKQIKPQKYMPA